jgi:hypothetical protein
MPACRAGRYPRPDDPRLAEGDVSTTRKLYNVSLPLLNFQAIFRMHMTKEVLRRRA